MEPKRIHLKDFPEDRIRIKFKNNKKFLDENVTYFGSFHKFAEFLSVPENMVRAWRKYNLFIPLKHIKRIVNKRKLNWTKIEREVISYKSPNSGLIIKNPKLPIVENPELFAIIGHLIADGSVNRNGIPVYTNSSKELINNFIRLIRNVFGNPKGKLYKSKSCYQYRFSRVFSDLISSFYNIQFGTYTATIPKNIRYLPKEFSIFIIRSITDDEGCVDFNHRINIRLKNKKVLSFIRLLLIKKLGFTNISPIYESRGLFGIMIKPKDLERYYKLIGFNHPLKKAKLFQIIKIRKNKLFGHRRKEDWTKNRILELLSTKRNLTTGDLALKLGFNKNSINIPIRNLIKVGLITQYDKRGQTIRWSKVEV